MKPWSSTQLPSKFARRDFGEEHSLVANAYINMALVLEEQDKLDGAMDLYVKSLQIDMKNLGEENAYIGNTHSYMATIFRKQGRLDEAMWLYEHSLKVKRDNLGEGHWSVAETLQNIAIVLRNQGKLEESMRFFKIRWKSPRNASEKIILRSRLLTETWPLCLKNKASSTGP
jgi:tetratricopeptide (TPR) repeat protein